MIHLMVLAENMFEVGFLLIITGFIVIFLAVILSAFTRKGGDVKGGGVILIGPFPIVFGSDTKTVKTLILLVLILMVFVLAIAFIPTITLWR